jgi:sugar lactone lactonase YvrE
MHKHARYRLAALPIGLGLLTLGAGAADAAIQIEGQVQAAGRPIANSTVTLWSASAAEPRQVAQARTGADGAFVLGANETPGDDADLYVTARGGAASGDPAGGNNPALALLSVLGDKPPAHIVVNEMTTIASVWTSAQFFAGSGIKGPSLGLRIAAGNVLNFVDPATGGYGVMIQDPLNSTQTPTMMNFATLASIMAGCTSRIKPDACGRFFAAATGRDGPAPADTLAAAVSIAHNMAYKPERVFALLDAFYPVPPGKGLRPTPFLPYQTFAPSAWVLPLKFTGGGYSGGAKVLFDSAGNAWSGANFIVGSVGHDSLWDGNLSEFAPNGRPLSPMTTGFAGGGLQGPGFGTAIDANDRVWINSTSGKTISLFDRHGKPISPPEGYNFGGKLGFMQGIIVTPGGDVWAVDFTNDKVVFLPKGDPAKARFYCEAAAGTPNKDGPCQLSAPFHIVIDQRNYIWVDNAIGGKVARFPADDPSKVEVFSTGGHSGKGMAVDSKGNVWIANTLGAGLSLETDARLLIAKVTGATLTGMDQIALHDLLSTPGMGNVSALRPDGTPLPGSPFNPTGSIWGAWAISIDGNDHVWISNFAPDGGITELCGARTETCPAGMKTGDAISPPGGYKGGGMQMLVDVSIDPAGNAWVSNNWQDPMSCYGKPDESVSTRCGGQGMTVFYGMARPVRAPQIGPAQPYN